MIDKTLMQKLILFGAKIDDICNKCHCSRNTVSIHKREMKARGIEVPRTPRKNRGTKLDKLGKRTVNYLDTIGKTPELKALEGLTSVGAKTGCEEAGSFRPRGRRVAK